MRALRLRKGLASGQRTLVALQFEEIESNGKGARVVKGRQREWGLREERGRRVWSKPKRTVIHSFYNEF